MKSIWIYFRSMKCRHVVHSLHLKISRGFFRLDICFIRFLKMANLKKDRALLNSLSISAPGTRFPGALVEPPRREALLRGLHKTLSPAEESSAIRSNLQGGRVRHSLKILLIHGIHSIFCEKSLGKFGNLVLLSE